MYRSTYDNSWVEDITDSVIEASVSCDSGRDITWTLDATITREGWAKLTPYLDWVAPVLTVKYPDGTTREGQLGLYLVMDSPEAHTEVSATIALDARDPLYLLSIQGFGSNVVCNANNNKMKQVRDLLGAAVLTEATAKWERNGKPTNAQPGPETAARRFIIPTDNATFKRAVEFEKKTPLLEIANDILFGAGYYPLYTTRTGIFTTSERKKSVLKRRTPVRRFVANVPESVDPFNRLKAVGGLPSDIVGEVQTVPKSADMTDEIVLICDTPHGFATSKSATITNEKNKRTAGRKKSGDGRKRRRRNEHVRTLDDDATAVEVAKALLDELSTTNSVISFSAIPDPSVDFARQTIDLHIFNLDGYEIANDRYAVHSVKYGFTPSSALMEITCGRVEDIKDERDN